MLNTKSMASTKDKLLLFLFFCSGLSALIYEVTWLRLLTLTFGNTADAATCTLAIFLGGIAFGACAYSHQNGR